MDILGLLLEFVFLAFAVYLYLFSRGMIQVSDPERSKKAEAFREKNGGWLRILSLALAAVMFLNVMLHIQEMMG